LLKTTNYTSHNEFFRTIDANTSVVLTPNRRLSATLYKLYQQYQIQLQKKYWPTPDILPIFSWVQRFFSGVTRQDFISHPLLLNPLQEQFIWEHILTNTKENDFLLQITETAELAKSAWRLLSEWQVDINDPIFESSLDYRAFKNWALQFQSLCLQNHWIDSTTLGTVITKYIKQGVLKPPAQIFLIGFTGLSPQVKHLLEVAEMMGCQVNLIEIIRKKINARKTCLIDEETEILTIARWAKSLSIKHPLATIGCVIPSLNKKRDRIFQVFSEVFAHEDQYKTQLTESPFNISAGKSLHQYPIIHAAIHFLSLHKKAISLASLSYLLTSPHLGEAEIERLPRAHFDCLLRQTNMGLIDVTSLINETQTQKSLSLKKYCPALAKRLSRFFSLLEKEEKKMSYSKWAPLFNECLSVLGWPGERSLNSEEYQIVENWLHFLADFMTLDEVSRGPSTIYQALQKLAKMASSLSFQPQSPETSIQVLGILEAGALPFDFLWVAGMDDVSWPSQPRPNPFVPKQLQRELQMPHATAERELSFCQSLTQQFKESASVSIFSHAEKQAEMVVNQSPLIEDLPEISLDQLSLLHHQPKALKIYQSKSMESILDERGPQVLSQEKIGGGADLIKQQALCPFKAFATYRLKAKELENPMIGLRPKDRGIITHKILEIIWNKLKNHETLSNMEESELNLILKESIATAIAAHIPDHRIDDQYIKLEKERCYQLIHHWLQIEKERGPFSVVKTEFIVEIKLNNLKLNLRIDRIDELCNGQQIIIDYKTGKNNTLSAWFGNRPDGPQLPLYALHGPQNIAAIAFAQIASSDHCFKGMSRSALDIKGIKLLNEIQQVTVDTWDDQLGLWKNILTQLSEDFYQGIAIVDPKNAHTCLTCAIKPLCRIDENGT
jgi:probable DNA repair protein